MTDFYSAQEAREQSISKRTILDEIQMIQKRILDGISNSQLTVVVGPGTDDPTTTGLTVDVDAFDAWNDPHNHNGGVYVLKVAQMNGVISHFSKLGYTITRSVQSTQDKTFNWNISW